MAKESFLTIIARNEDQVANLITASDLTLDSDTQPTPFTVPQTTEVDSLIAELRAGVAVGQITEPRIAELLRGQENAPIRLRFPNTPNSLLDTASHKHAEAIGIIMPSTHIDELRATPLVHIRYSGAIYLENGKLLFSAPMAQDIQRGGDIEDTLLFLATTGLYAKSGGSNHGHNPGANPNRELGHQLEYGIEEIKAPRTQKLVSLYRESRRLGSQAHLHMSRNTHAFGVSTAQSSVNTSEAALPFVVSDIYLARNPQGEMVTLATVRSGDTVQLMQLPNQRVPFATIEQSTAQITDAGIYLKPETGDPEVMQKLIVARVIQTDSVDGFKRRLG